MDLSINKLTKISIIVLLGSILLTLMGFNDVFKTQTTSTPFTIILSQTIWNAAKVFFYLLLVLRFITSKNILVKIFLLFTIGLLPFSQYLLSPGGFILSILMFILFFVELKDKPLVINVSIREGKKDGRFSLQKFEVLGFLCCFLCSLYNARASGSAFPYWNTWFSWLNSMLGWPEEASNFVKNLYSMGLHISIPPSLPHANYHGVGLLIFSLIWSILPFLYVLYFIVLYIESKNAPYVKIQKILCFICIFHFLFLTNLVGYRFSRGWDNSYAEWFHWVEKFAWRVAILLPIYQNIFSGFWKKNSNVTLLHSLMMIFGLFFLIYQVLIYDVLNFISFVRGENLIIFEKISPYYFYHRALVFMSLYYLLRLMLNSKSHLWVIKRSIS